jgi:hypothetical protein
MDFKLVSPEAPLLDTRKEKNIQHLAPQKMPTLLFPKIVFTVSLTETLVSRLPKTVSTVKASLSTELQ